MKVIKQLSLVSLSIAALGITQATPIFSQRVTAQSAASSQATQTQPLQQSFIAANNLKISVKEVAPYNQPTQLQIICYFKHKASGDTVLSAVADLDQKLGGLIQSLRNSGQFVGEERETIVFGGHGWQTISASLLRFRR